MDSIWANTKKLEGTTLYTATHKKPFEIIQVDEDALVMQPRGGRPYRVTRARIEKAWRHMLSDGKVPGKSLAKAGMKIARSYIYLPIIVEAILSRERSK